VALHFFVIVKGVFGDAHVNHTTSETGRPAGAQRLLFMSAMLFILLASILLRREPTPDVSWLITMCERILQGERAYVDIFETTPPVPMLLYMPGVLFARLTGVTPEAATFAFAYASAFVSLGLSERILPTYVADGGQSKWLVILPAAVILLILPNDAFAQREYFAAAFALPMVSVFVRHAADGVWPPLWQRIIAAILAGLTIAIKPPLFALPGIVVAGYYWLRMRSLSFLIPSGLLAAGVIGAAVTAASLEAFPDYLGGITTLMRDVYIPARSDFFAFLGDKACLGVLSCLVLALIITVKQKPPLIAIFALMAAIGFLAAYFIQAKYFPYQGFPAALFGGIAVWVLIYGHLRAYAPGPSAPNIIAIGVYTLAILEICGLFAIGFDDGRPVMSDLSWAAGLDQPRALAISADLDIAFPLARRIGAVWVDRTHSQWVARYTRFELQSAELTESERAKLLYYHKQELERILRQIREKTPDIIIQDIRPGDSWLTSELLALNPRFLDGYEAIAEEGWIRVLQRKAGPVRKFPNRSGSDARETGHLIQP
jgi:hypothetical protein